MEMRLKKTHKTDTNPIIERMIMLGFAKPPYKFDDEETNHNYRRWFPNGNIEGKIFFRSFVSGDEVRIYQNILGIPESECTSGNYQGKDLAVVRLRSFENIT